MGKKKQKKPWSVFVAIVAAIIFGNLVGQDKTVFGVSLYSAFDVAGTLFLNALMLVVVPLVSASIITGIAKVGGEKNFGRLGAKMFTFYIATNFVAILIGLIFVNMINPGYGQQIVAVSEEAVKSHAHLVNHDTGKALVSLLLSIVPSNILDAFAKGEMLALIFFSLLFGISLAKIKTEAGSTLQNFFQGLFQTMIQVTHLIMRVLPFGVFCLVAKIFMVTGISSLGNLALFTTTVLMGLAVFMLGVLPMILSFIARVNPLTHFKAMAPALVTAFSTSSSSATLPITLDCAEKRSGISNKVASLVIPLGTSINMSGSALYECVAAMFVAQAYGVDLSFSTQFLVVMTALISSIGVAGIPSASLVAILVILKVIGLPAEGIGLFIAVDRLLDMCRTTVNVFSDSCCAALVAASEGEKILTTDQFEEE